MAPRYRHPIGPIPTLGQLRRDTPWLWVYCTAGIRRNCVHKAPMALAPLIIRWGEDASSNVLRQRARCTACGTLGAMLQHPGHVDSIVGLAPFPTR
jgi:hypothetical protein